MSFFAAAAYPARTTPITPIRPGVRSVERFSGAAAGIMGAVPMGAAPSEATPAPDRAIPASPIQTLLVQDIAVSIRRIREKFLLAADPRQSLAWESVKEALEAHNTRLAKTLDALSPENQKEFVAWYCETTGFPNLEETTRRIEAAWVKALHAAEKNVRKKLVHAGYDPTCSVGRGLALPGSDLDDLTLLVRGNHRDALGFYLALIPYIDPLMMDFSSAHPDRIAATEDIRLLLCSGKSPHQLRQLTESRAAALIYLAESMAVGKSLTPDIQTGLKTIETERFYELSGISRPQLEDKVSRYLTGLKTKHQKRLKLAQAFDALPGAEQFAVIRLLLDQTLGIPVNTELHLRNPHGPALEGLRQAELLELSSGGSRSSTSHGASAFHAIAPWMHHPLNTTTHPYPRNLDSEIFDQVAKLLKRPTPVADGIFFRKG